MARIIIYSDKKTGKITPYSSLKVLLSHVNALPFKYDHLGDLLREKEEIENDKFKIQRLEIINK